MIIFIKTLTGQTITIDNVEDTWIILDVMIKIKNEFGIPIDQQRLIFDSRQLEQGKSISNYEITNESTIHLILRLRGMISSFTNIDTNDPLIRYLMLSDEDRANAPIPFTELRQKCQSESANPSHQFRLRSDQELGGVLTYAHRERLSSFLSFMWDRVLDKTTNSADMVDMRLKFKDYYEYNGGCKAFVRLMEDGLLHDRKLFPLYREYTSPGDNKLGATPYIVLRMTKGPTNSCINFHCDGANGSHYSVRTVQIAINSSREYKGGKLCFFQDGKLHVLHRPAGSVCQHHPGVLHGVTAMTEGIRKSIFVLDHDNGANDPEVINVEMEDVEAFFAAKPTPSDSQVARYPNTSSASGSKRQRANDGTLVKNHNDQTQSDPAMKREMILQSLEKECGPSLHQYLTTSEMKDSNATEVTSTVKKYLQFMIMKGFHNDHHGLLFTPLPSVDTVWRSHILDTRNYQKLCSIISAGFDSELDDEIFHRDFEQGQDKKKEDALQMITASVFNVMWKPSNWDDVIEIDV